MRNLKIEYRGMVLFDGEISELQWSDGEGGVTVHGKLAQSVRKQSGANLLEMIAGASKKKTELMVEQKRESLTEEKAKEVVDSVLESELG